MHLYCTFFAESIILVQNIQSIKHSTNHFIVILVKNIKITQNCIYTYKIIFYLAILYYSVMLMCKTLEIQIF